MSGLGSLVVMLALVFNPHVMASPTDHQWSEVDRILSDFTNLSQSSCPKCRGFAFTAGNASGRQYTFTKGSITMETPLLMASASKFPAAAAIAGAVADGHLTFDTAAHQVFEWWSSSPTDPRSGVTLRQLLSFTSGFYWPDASSGNCSCMGLVGGFTFSSEDCARQIYSQAPFKYKAGTTWAYNSFHLQIAGAMAAKAAGVTVQELLHRYLIGKLSLKSTGWLLGRNPVLAAGMHTTPTDYDRILSAYLSYELLPEQVAREMERDYLANGTKLCDWCPELTGSLGDYSMCNWYECIRDKPGEPFSKQCRDANVHNDAGLFGYYPVFDRTKAMYMQIAQSVLVGLNDTNPGVNGAMELRQLVKPAVDDALTSGTQASVQSQAAGLPANVSQVSRVPSEWLNYPELPATYWNDLVDSFARMDL